MSYARRLLPAAGTPVLTDVITGMVGGQDTEAQVVKWVFGAEGLVVPVSLNAGAADAGTQRHILASNDPAVVALQALATGLGLVSTVAPDYTANTDEKKPLSLTLAGELRLYDDQVRNAVAALQSTLQDRVGAIDTDAQPIGALVLASASAALSASNEGSNALWLRVVAYMLSLIYNDTSPAIVTGNVAQGAADTGNPVKMGGRAVTAEITPVAANTRTDFITDKVGKQVVLPYANPENFVSGTIQTPMTAANDVLLLAAPGAGLRNYITTIVVSNSHATVGTDIFIKDGAGGNVIMTIPAASVYGGAALTLPTPLRQPSANIGLYCQNVTTGSSTRVTAVGYKGV